MHGYSLDFLFENGIFKIVQKLLFVLKYFYYFFCKGTFLHEKIPQKSGKLVIEFVDFSESLRISIFFTILKKKIYVLKNYLNFTNFGYIFITRFHITLENFPGDWTNSFTIIASIDFSKTVPKRFTNLLKKNVDLLLYKKKWSWHFQHRWIYSAFSLNHELLIDFTNFWLYFFGNFWNASVTHP